jgi:hypothetical protein
VDDEKGQNNNARDEHEGEDYCTLFAIKKKGAESPIDFMVNFDCGETSNGTKRDDLWQHPGR